MEKPKADVYLRRADLEKFKSKAEEIGIFYSTVLRVLIHNFDGDVIKPLAIWFE